jgi:Asp-tRNA(Asn)/Glu-tRNA(Gln) amidotransferase A subunit family amidase
MRTQSSLDGCSSLCRIDDATHYFTGKRREGGESGRLPEKPELAQAVPQRLKAAFDWATVAAQLKLTPFQGSANQNRAKIRSGACYAGFRFALVQAMTSVLPSATEIAEQIRDRQVSPVEVAQNHLERIARLNPQLNAFVDHQPEVVLAQARAAEKAVQLGDLLGPLHGVPLSIKSSMDVTGHRCEAGSRLRAGHIPTEDAAVVARLRAAGAIILGVTNAPEYLMAWETDNLLYGRTNHPYDVERTAGGSSGGEAAAIASGMSAGGLGSDGGGSIRVPAHFCGICGLKPTPGRISSAGHFPKAGGPFATIGVVGPMARTVADLQLLFGVMAGWDEGDIRDGDPSSAPVPVREVHEKDVVSTLIGFFEDDERTPVTKETREAVAKAASLLSNAGFGVERFRPEGLEDARRLWWDYFGVAGGMILGREFRGRETELSPTLQQFLSWTQAAPSHTGDSLLGAWLERDSVREKILVQMRKHPILLCPVAAVPAFRHGEREWQIDGKTVKYLDAWSYCEWFNLLGFPAVVVPMAFSEEGLPIGVQIIGQPWEEELVLAVAAKLEAQRGPMASSQD